MTALTLEIQPITTGGIVAAIGALGSSSAAVLVVYFFLQFFRRKQLDFERRDEERTRQLMEFIGRQQEALRDCTVALREAASARKHEDPRAEP